MAQADRLNITRRSLALAGIGAIVGAATPASAAFNESPLLPLWREYERLVARWEAAVQICRDASDDYERLKLPMPDSLIVARREAGVLVPLVGKRGEDGRRYYAHEEIEKLRSSKNVAQCMLLGDKAGYNRRGAEVVAAYDRWAAECARLMEPSIARKKILPKRTRRGGAASTI